MLQAELDKVAIKHLKWLKNEGGERADLREANLIGADLRDANLTEADLREADLRAAKLIGVNIRGANLRGANLRWVDLRWADLCEADLSEANLSDANLSEANLSGVNIRGADLRWVNLRGVKNFLLGPQRSDGFLFYAHKNGDNGWQIRAGCRDFGFLEWREHAKKYEDLEKRRETEWIIDSLEARINQTEKAL